MKPNIKHKLMCTLTFAFGLSIGSLYHNKIGWYDLAFITLLTAVFYVINTLKFSPLKYIINHKGS
jgi:hypothetical protein